MDISDISRLVIRVVLVVLGIYDVWVVVRYGSTASLTVVIREASKQYPIFPLLAGIILGHLFWGDK
jgi:hypothetical protein